MPYLGEFYNSVNLGLFFSHCVINLKRLKDKVGVHSEVCLLLLVSVHTLTACQSDLDMAIVFQRYQMKGGCEGHTEPCGHQRTIEQLGGRDRSRTDGDGWRHGCPLLSAYKVNSSTAGPYVHPDAWYRSGFIDSDPIFDLDS